MAYTLTENDITTLTANGPMNKAAKRNWLARLRSSHYRKGTKTLYDPTRKTYCCLGVLARDPACPIARYEFNSLHELEAEQLNWASLTDDVQGVLVSLNDLRRVNFNFIADVIEKYL